MAAVLLPKWDCDTCNASLQKIRGCGYPGTTATVMDKKKLSTCPRYFIKREGRAFNKIATAYDNMQRGFLPEEGGINDQPAKLMEAVEHFQAGLNEARSSQNK